MKTAKEIREQIKEEEDRLTRSQGHLASITRGWLDALWWVLDENENS